MSIDLSINEVDKQLLQLLNEQLNTEEQKLFVKSFQIYLFHNDNDTAFIIDLDNIYKWIGFSRKDPAKRVLIKFFENNKDYIIKNEVFHRSVGNSNGRPSELIFLTINCFKKFCMKVSTKRANEICNYYLKMENIMHQYINNINKENSEKILKINTELQNANIQIEIERHNILIQIYSMRRVVYIMKVITLKDGYFIIKIGESENIKERIEKLSTEFNTKIIVLDIFTCEDSRAFEKFLHKHPDINKHKYLELINNKSSTELFKVSLKDYHKIVKYANKYLNNYNKNIELTKLRIKEKELDIKNKIISICTSKDDLFKALELLNTNSLDNVFINSNTLDNVLDNNELLDNLSSNEKKNNIIIKEEVFKENNIIIKEEVSKENNIIIKEEVSKEISREYGPRVQIYNKDDLTKVIKVFNGITDATREIKNSNYTHIKHASKYKLEYLNYRWYLLDRNDLQPDKPKNIGETVASKQNKNSFVVMLNLEKNNIEKVFQLQKDAANYIQQQISGINNAIKYFTKVGGYYWILWENAPEELKNRYLENNILPQKYKTIRGAKVQQIDPITDKVIKVFLSITDVAKEMKISPKTIKNVSLNNSIHKEYKWKII